jgi:hypothetical protein
LGWAGLLPAGRRLESAGRASASLHKPTIRVRSSHSPHHGGRTSLLGYHEEELLLQKLKGLGLDCPDHGRRVGVIRVGG